nr:mechanosensitive ion channel family protein [Argonema antarcticum]
MILVFYLFNWLFGIISKHSIKVSWLKGRAEKIKLLRRNISRLSLFICVVLCLALIGANGLLLYQDKNVQEYQLALIYSIPIQFWQGLVTAILKSISLLSIVGLSVKPLHSLLDVICDRTKRYEKLSANDESVETFFSLLKINLTNSIWFLAVILCAQFLLVPQVVINYLYIALRIYIIIALGILFVKAISAIVNSLDDLGIKYSRPDNWLRFYDHLRQALPLIQKYLEYVIYVSMATLVVLQIDFIAGMAVYGPRIIQIIGIIFFSGFLVQVTNLTIEEILLKNKTLTDLQKQRRLTIIPLIQSFVKYLIYFTGGIAILRNLNIDPTPILAGAGIVGLAVGFGAQNLINDMVCGFFILFENYYLVGDYIQIKDSSGFVEAIDLRTTRIRHPNGQLYIVRNGEINNIINYSKQYIYAVVEVRVSYESNLDRVYAVIEKLGRELNENNEDVLEPTLVDGVEKFDEYNLLIRTITKVKPGTHNKIQRLLRKLIKDLFDREGIEIPFVRRILIVKNYPESDSLNTDIELL